MLSPFGILKTFAHNIILTTLFYTLKAFFAICMALYSMYNAKINKYTIGTRIAEVRSRSMSCNFMTRTSQQECRGILEWGKGAGL